MKRGKNLICLLIGFLLIISLGYVSLIIAVDYPSMPTMPELPSMPSMPSLPSMPSMPSMPDPFGGSFPFPTPWSWGGSGSGGCRTSGEYVAQKFSSDSLENYISGCAQLFPTTPPSPYGKAYIEASSTSANQFCKEKGYEKACQTTSGGILTPLSCIYYYSGGWQLKMYTPYNSYYSEVWCDKRACTLETCASKSYECGSFTDSCKNARDCGNPCPNKFSNAVGDCSNFVCVISKCTAGYSDCNKLKADGCEIILNTDNDNCGKCGNKCNLSATENPTTCINGACSSVAEPYWGNMKGNKTTQVDLNDLVKLILAVPQGGEINLQNKVLEYEIYKDVKWWLDTRMAQGSDKGYTVWRAGKKTNGDLEAGKYYFKVKVGNQWFKSGTLIVKGEENDSPPKVKITNPSQNNEDKGRYRKDQNISFIVTLEDEDDDLKVTWEFGDGISEIYENCLTGNNCNSEHAYSKKGTKVIYLTAEEIGRTQKAFDYSRIFIYDLGTNVFAVINNPVPGSALENRLVNFDASGTYVSFCDNACHSGKTCYLVGNLYCYNLEEPRVYGNYDFNMAWDFSDKIKKSGRWSEIFNEIVMFKKEFFTSTKTRNRADLKVTVLGGDGGSDETFTSFYIKDDSAVCEAGQRQGMWLTWQGDNLIKQNSSEDCIRGGRTCCSLTSSCNLDTGKCSKPQIDYCGNYTNEDECESYNEEVARASVNLLKGSGYCGSSLADETNENCRFLIANCGCTWNANNSKCDSTFEKIESCHVDNGDSRIVGSCQLSISETEGDCNEGDEYMTFNWKNEWVCDASIPTDQCEGYKNPECDETLKTKTVTCATVTKLPFFNFINVLIVIFVLIVIYFFIIKNKK